MKATRAAVLLGSLVLLAGCGTERVADEPAPDVRAAPVERPTEVPAADGEVTTGGPVTVLDEGGGPEVCLGGVATSLPPQCSGPRALGWDWAEHEGDFEEAAGTRWGDFVVTGTFDGTDLTVTDVVPVSEYDAPPAPDHTAQFDTPCPEPEDGWIVDPAKASERDQDKAFRVAERLDDYASSFIDTSRDPRTPEEMDQGVPAPPVSPWIVNVSVTDDPVAAETAIREVWGGGLCITEARVTDRELARIQNAVDDLPGMTYSSRQPDAVDVGVTYDDGSIQAWADQEYGEGVVVVTSALQPV